MKKFFVVTASALVFAGCGGGAATGPTARYDLGGEGGRGAGPGLPLAGVDVQSASWLAGSDMQYRLAFAEPLQRRSYVESRWVAPPGELLEGVLRRRLSSAPGSSGCRLLVALDEFEHRFSSPQTSTAVIEMRAVLAAPRGEALLRRSVAISRAAASADARGAAGAAREAASLAAEELESWLADAARDRAVNDRCKS